MSAECAVAPSVLYVDKPILAVNDPEGVVVVGGYPQKEGGLTLGQFDGDEVAVDAGGQRSVEETLVIGSGVSLSFDHIVDFDGCSIGGCADANPLCKVAIEAVHSTGVVDANRKIFDFVVPVERIIADVGGQCGG